jgi:hypothetical protein
MDGWTDGRGKVYKTNKEPVGVGVPFIPCIEGICLALHRSPGWLADIV